MALTPITVRFTAEDGQEIQEITDLRCQQKNPGNSRKMSKDYSNELVERWGVIGEFAIEKATGWPMDKELRLGGDGGVDFTVPGLGTVSAKFNHRANGYLLFEDREGDQARISLSEFKTDVAVLVDGVCDPPECSCKIREWWRRPVRVVGWIEQADFLMASTWVNWGYGVRWFVRQKRLKDMAHLLESPSMDAEGAFL